MLPVKAVRPLGGIPICLDSFNFYVLNADREAALICHQSQGKMSIKVNMTSPLEVE